MILSSLGFKNTYDYFNRKLSYLPLTSLNSKSLEIYTSSAVFSKTSVG